MMQSKDKEHSVPVSGIGADLRGERLRQGLTLDDIVQRTRISLRSLESLEADAFDRLPGLVFTRSFVRMYATELGLDPEAFLARIPRVDIETTPMPVPPAGSGRGKWDPRLTASLASLLWIATAAGAGAGAWYYANHYGIHLVTTVASTPAPAKRVAPSPAPAQAADTNQNASAAPTAQSQDAGNSTPSPNASGEASQTMQASTANSYDGNRPVQVILTAREAAWVQISADGRTAFVGTLKQHESRVIAADAQVKVITGNAGGLDISLNGKPLDPIGPSGQVRTVRLTAEGPQLVPRTPPASSPL